ncbi:MAG: hypothetical protein COW65_17735 [Cytophagales bacterium CG18_big_fil_WC_8_21_14_2_50_42_9]|nr:MAG: hypothetical protein COW65_17735 [Cytophagales bacterium CG18_big_fil_WC_8_21_14_2_50_42_9]
MNWPTRITVLFIFSVFAFFSCEDNTELGLEEVGADIELGTSYKDDFTIEAATVLAPDSILAFGRGNLLTGRITNNNFGTVTATSFLEVETITSTVTGAAGAQVDSMVLALDYDESYGDTTQNLTINVHQLQQPFSETSTYYTNSTLPYEPATLGSATFKPAPKIVKTEVVSTTNSGTTTSTTVKRSLPARIRLNNALAAQILAQSSSTLGSQTEFVKFFPGIAITANTDAKAVLGFRPTADSTYLKIYYTSGGTKYQYQLSITTGNNYFSNINADFTGTPLAALRQAGDSLPALNVNNQAFLQESVGLKTKISFPDLKQFKKTLGDVAINRAELIIPATSVPFNIVSPYIYLYETNKTNRILRNTDSKSTPRGLSDGNSNPFYYTSPYPGSYSTTNQEYKINITSYVQALLYNTMPANIAPSSGLIISPASIAFTTGTDPLDLLGLQTLRQTILNTAGDKRIALRVYYTARK